MKKNEESLFGRTSAKCEVQLDPMWFMRLVPLAFRVAESHCEGLAQESTVRFSRSGAVLDRC